MNLTNFQQYIDTKLTKKVEGKEISRWLPFIGKEYTKAPKKVLVLGLSHYDKGQSENWTNILASKFPNIVSVCENGLSMNHQTPNKQRMFRGLERCFFNVPQYQLYKNEFNLKRKGFWQSIAFQQFIETPMETTKHDKNVEGKEIIERDPYLRLIELVDTIKPDHIVMLSNSYAYHEKLKNYNIVFENKNNEQRIYVSLKSNRSDIRTCYFNFDGHNCTFTALMHPSRYRYIDKQHSLLKKTTPSFISYIQN